MVCLLILLIILLLLLISNTVMLSSQSASTTDPRCNDNNTCTTDICIHDGCKHLDAKNGLPCENICFENNNHTCQGGECVGDNCLGNCVYAQDCPPVPNPEGNGFLTVECRFGACIYVDTFEEFDLDNLILCKNEIFEKMCTARLTEEFLLKDCLVNCPLCNKQGGKVSRCIYNFDCAEPVFFYQE